MTFSSRSFSPPLDNIRVMVIVWSLRWIIIRTALSWIVWHSVHSLQHTYMSSSYRSNRLGLSHWDPYAVRRGSCLELYYCNMFQWFWWDSSLISTTNCFPSVLWHCWFGHPVCKNRPWNDLLCVEWDVKPLHYYSYGVNRLRFEQQTEPHKQTMAVVSVVTQLLFLYHSECFMRYCFLSLDQMCLWLFSRYKGVGTNWQCFYFSPLPFPCSPPPFFVFPSPAHFLLIPLEARPT